jgi:hypothetical protein
MLENSLKYSLTNGQILRLLGGGARSNVFGVPSNLWRAPVPNMTDFLAWFAPAVLAAAATAASFLLLQFALLVV